MSQESEIERLTKLLADREKEIKKLKGDESRVPRKVKEKTEDKKPRKLTKKEKLEAQRIEKLPERKLGMVSSKTLQKHQLEFADNFINGDIRGAIAIHGVGSGKTLTAVICAEMFLKHDYKRRVVVITPASLLAGFKEELYSYDPAIEKDDRYLFFTYDGFSNAVKKEKNNMVKLCSGSLLIIDEGQNLRTNIKMTTKYTFEDDTLEQKETVKSGLKVFNILRSCALVADKVLILSATPMVNSPEDIENLMAMINGHLPLDSSSVAFKTLWNHPKLIQKYFGCRLSFFENSPAIRDKYFPRVEEVFVPIVMNDRTLSAYKQVESGNPSERVRNDLNISDDAKSINSFYNGVRRASNAIGGIHSQKVDFIISFVKGILSKTPNAKVGLTQKILDTHTDKSVIFTHFLDTGSKLIKERLKEEGISFGDINGSVSKANRSKIVANYVSGKIKVILISKAGAEGLNLLETGYIFMMEPSWNNAEREQVKGRSVRFMSHFNLPPEKQNVLVLSLFLIKPREKPYFNKLINGEDVKKLKDGRSVDILLYNKSNAKQNFLDDALNTLRKTDPLEDCKHTKDFLDISNLFQIQRQGELPEPTSWEKGFYNTGIKNDNLSLPTGDASMDDLKLKMLDLTRKVFGGEADLVKVQDAFFTPPSIAHDMVVFAGIPLAKSDVLFLEPCAGAGFIIYEALLASDFAYCNAVERLKDLREFLEDFPRTEVLPQRNFFTLSQNNKYRVVIMNPPYKLKKGEGLSKRRTTDIDFVMKAFEHLEPDGILVALVSSDYEHKGVDKTRVAYKIYEPFRQLLKDNDHFVVKYEDGFSKDSDGETGIKMRLIKILKKSGAVFSTDIIRNA